MRKVGNKLAAREETINMRISYRDRREHILLLLHWVTATYHPIAQTKKSYIPAWQT